MVMDMKPGDAILGYYMIKSSEVKNTASNSKFLNLNLGDSTGEINARYWDFRDAENPYQAGMILKVKGQVLDWQGNLQIRLEKIRIANEEDDVNPGDFVQVAPYAPSEMYDFLYSTAEKFKNHDLRNIVLKVLDDNKDTLMYFPAAKKNHHAVMAGLLYHTSSMLKAGINLCSVYDFLDRDLLYSGVILHDMGKMVEMKSDNFGIVEEYTAEGNLLGHIIQGISMIEHAGEAVGADRETVMLLSHMVLSHHYLPEYGSPKYPMFPEAEMLHYLDIIDARMYDMKRVSEGLEEGKFSDKIWSMENRQIYKSRLP